MKSTWNYIKAKIDYTEWKCKLLCNIGADGLSVQHQEITLKEQFIIYTIGHWGCIGLNEYYYPVPNSVLLEWFIKNTV